MGVNFKIKNMKYIFLSLLILIAFAAKSQNKQPLITGSVTPNITISCRGRIIPAINEESDTVKVIMLVCDTSYINGFDSFFIMKDFNSGKSIGGAKHHANQTFWQYGYEIWDKEFTEPFIFIDENKKPLSKNIIVWQTITCSNGYLNSKDWDGGFNKQPINQKP